MTKAITQPVSFISKPKRSISLANTTLVVTSSTPIAELQAAIASYSGSSNTRPAYFPSVTFIIWQCFAVHAQQGLGLASNLSLIYWKEYLSSLSLSITCTLVV